MQVYNLVQIAVCSYMSFGFLQHSFDIFNPFGINVDYDPYTEWFCYVHYLSKYLDLFDTLFILLKKDSRRLSLLHVYHHATVVLVWGVVAHNGQLYGATYFAAFMNSIVHVIMYSHYFLTSLGINNPYKAMITKVQLLQFWLGVTQAILVLMYEQLLDTRYAVMELLYYISMVVLFSNFYNKTYK